MNSTSGCKKVGETTRRVHDARFHLTLAVSLVWAEQRKLGPVYVQWEDAAPTEPSGKLILYIAVCRTGPAQGQNAQ